MSLTGKCIAVLMLFGFSIVHANELTVSTETKRSDSETKNYKR